eukprot:10745581-Karenia_brevis.AAC.1
MKTTIPAQADGVNLNVNTGEKFKLEEARTCETGIAYFLKTQNDAKIPKRTNLWTKFAITLCSLLLYVHEINGVPTGRSGASETTKSEDIKQWTQD